MMRDVLLSRACELDVRRRHSKGAVRGRPHGLPGELIVSLTSYPARFPTLHLTLRSLLRQTTRPDRLILWIAHDDINLLPRSVHKLTRQGLEIRACEDLRSYKKLIPAIEAFPDAFIVTADDDLYYGPHWLKTLVEVSDRQTIVCHRAHRPVYDQQGRLRPYREWELSVHDEAARAPSTAIMPTSGAGVLYPPGSLHRTVTDRSLFEALCPDGDDLWFYWCARMAGTLCRKVGPRMRLIPWSGTQDSSLWNSNERGGNDRMIAALQARFGVLRS